MNNYELSEIFNNLHSKIKSIENKINKIKKNLKDINFNFNEKNLNLILELSQTANVLNDKTDDLNYIILENLIEENLSSEDKLLLRNNKINNIIHKIFIPYMLYLRICLENSNV